ncbi:Segmentation polarity homeobox protein engrailed [Eumeta japonica]|uniref:Segmentation polarity homeobox protein engrailed n=1 Tax=Eumeta variegata TaxID=151549 RepID=A0A4C1Z2Y3_EUMVA|nr:Segmentation polarity homeobox protein engrailed [Eumeta japonica]
MAFEDRCSPNQANSPGPITGRVPAPHGENMNIEYNQSQYSCTTIDQRYQNQMTVVKVQPVSPPPSPQNRDYHNYYQEKQEMELKQENYDEKRNKQQANAPINFSISNILHPDFGPKKTNKIEGPKPAGPNHSILYKPYDLSKTDTNKYQRTYYDYISKNDEPTVPLPPLGGLRQTVSQIGERDGETKVTDLSSKRPDSASSMVSSTSSGTSSQDASQSQSSNATLWPAWVYCTRYSDRPSSG